MSAATKGTVDDPCVVGLCGCGGWGIVYNEAAEVEMETCHTPLDPSLDIRTRKDGCTVATLLVPGNLPDETKEEIGRLLGQIARIRVPVTARASE